MVSQSLQESFDARLFPYGWDTPGFNENNEWIAAAELRGPANKSSASNGNSNYQLDISGDIESQLRKRSIPLMKENKVGIKKLTEAYWIEWKLPSENYFDMVVPGAFVASSMSPMPGFTKKTITLNPMAIKPQYWTFEFDEQSVGWPYFTIDAPEGTVIEMLVMKLISQAVM